MTPGAAVGTRERILDVSLRLFTEQGYEGTSLREIADELGFTKAALYYHFQSKEQILTALVEPLGILVHELLSRLEVAADAEEWAGALEWLIGQMSTRLDFFALVERNRPAIEALSNTIFNDHQQMHERVETAVRTKGDLPMQVRMMAALGAVTAFDDWAPRLLAETPPEQLSVELVAVTRDILGLPRRRAARARATAAR